MERYIIHWEDTLSNHSGKGKPVDKETGEIWVNYLNKRHPDVHHWLEHCDQVSSSNPNNCSTCSHKDIEHGNGWCYMLQYEPKEVCGRHSTIDLKAMYKYGYFRNVPLMVA